MRETTTSSRRPPPADRVMCHDLTQYVTAAMLVTELPDDDRLSPAVRERFALIHRQLQQMHAVLQDCLHGRGAEASADVVTLVRECVAALAMHHQIDFVQELPPTLLTGDHTALRRAVGNILDNAVRATDEVGRVIVSVAGSPEAVLIEVQDTGQGFGRLGPGSGLGMQSVADALDSFHGSLEINSHAGCGTSVRLVLPRERP
jgi:signal transduction histidine kinase